MSCVLATYFSVPGSSVPAQSRLRVTEILVKRKYLAKILGYIIQWSAGATLGLFLNAEVLLSSEIQFSTEVE